MGIQNSFFPKTSPTPTPVIVITGACRSGKTLLGNILATYREVEYADEPYAPMLLPMVVKSGRIEEEFAAGWFAAMLRELFNDLVLLRAGNFRPGDLSSIWTKKSPAEIFERLVQLKTRSDVAAHADRAQSRLVVTLAESMPFIDFIKRAVPHAVVVHVVRQAHAVAADVTAKSWFSDEQLIAPGMQQLYSDMQRDGKTWHLPWWVDDQDHAYFLDLSTLDRGAYYWCSLIEKGEDAFARAECSAITVRYEDLTANPVAVFAKLSAQLGLTPGELTEAKLREVRSHSAEAPRPRFDSRLEERIKAASARLHG